MKSNFLRLSYFAIAAAGMLTACNQENVSSDMANSGNVLSISVSQNDFSPVDAESRAVTDLTDRTTTFENGDKLGLYVVSNADGSYHYENVPFTYNGESWASASTIYYYKNSDYIVYYPYVEDLQLTVGETGVSGAIKTVFESKADFYTQNTADAYEAVDLMMAEVENPSDANVDFKLAHKFSMIEISVPVRKYITEKTYNGEKFEYNAPVKLEWATPLKYGDNDVTPYAAGKGVYRFIVKPGESVAVNIDGYVQYEEEPFNFSNENASLTLTEGSFKHYKVTVEGISDEVTTRDLKVGDYYYSDGSIYPYGDQTGDHNLKNPIKEGCIGVIYDVENGVSGTDWIHASVISLVSAGDNTWGSTSGTYVSQENLFEIPNDGFNTSIQCAANDNESACYKAIYFKGDNNQYAAPAKISSGWYLPSAWQLLMFMKGFGVNVNSEEFDAFGTNNRGDKNAAVTNFDKAKNIILGESSSTIAGPMWWTSSEVSSSQVWAIEWKTSNIRFLGRPSSESRQVRPVLSF